VNTVMNAEKFFDLTYFTELHPTSRGSIRAYVQGLGGGGGARPCGGANPRGVVASDSSIILQHIF
jgi:hypothetical protein